MQVTQKAQKPGAPQHCEFSSQSRVTHTNSFLWWKANRKKLPWRKTKQHNPRRQHGYVSIKKHCRVFQCFTVGGLLHKITNILILSATEKINAVFMQDKLFETAPHEALLREQCDIWEEIVWMIDRDWNQMVDRNGSEEWLYHNGSCGMYYHHYFWRCMVLDQYLRSQNGMGTPWEGRKVLHGTSWREKMKKKKNTEGGWQINKYERAIQVWAKHPMEKKIVEPMKPSSQITK